MQQIVVGWGNAIVIDKLLDKRMAERRKGDRGKGANDIGARSGYNLSVLFSATTTAIMRLLRRTEPFERRYPSLLFRYALTY